VEAAAAAATTTIAVRVQWCGEIENETMDLRAGGEDFALHLNEN